MGLVGLGHTEMTAVLSHIIPLGGYERRIEPHAHVVPGIAYVDIDRIEKAFHLPDARHGKIAPGGILERHLVETERGVVRALGKVEFPGPVQRDDGTVRVIVGMHRLTGPLRYLGIHPIPPSEKYTFPLGGGGGQTQKDRHPRRNQLDMLHSIGIRAPPIGSGRAVLQTQNHIPRPGAYTPCAGWRPRN